MTDVLTTESTGLPTPYLGAVFTRPWVVDLILDLAGYTADKDLAALRVVEPSAGHGAFVVAMARRLTRSCREFGRPITDAIDAIRAFDIDPTATAHCRTSTIAGLVAEGVDAETATQLATRWIETADFLSVAPSLDLVTWVIGNPPYVRIEAAEKDALERYRREWKTMSGRADLYVAFIEAGLSILQPEGRVAFICADRWMRNRYGAALRSLIVERFAVDACVILHDVDAFEDSVAAYPAVTVLRAGDQRSVMVCEARGSFGEQAASQLSETWRRGLSPTKGHPGFEVSWTQSWFSSNTSWPSGSPEILMRLALLEQRFPTLEETGAKVSVGVATGADDVYVQPAGTVEVDREIPAVSAKEIATGVIESTGNVLINPWTEAGLAPLEDFPRLRRFFGRHADRLRGRYVARNNPERWWRTIDRIHPALVTQPKLLIPDLKNRIHPVLDVGDYYPLHNLYYVTSDNWDLRVLGGLLMSRIANEFVESYSVRMASGYMRVSAQYLRLVRLPRFEDIDSETRSRLADAFEARDIDGATQAAEVAYGLVAI